MKADLILKDDFRQALDDYFLLMNNGYPEKGSLKLVGDRYRLSTDLRMVLYRGVCPGIKADDRKQRITNSPGDILIIDGYNVLFTLLNYRLGRFVFISNDGICRDAGSLFGKIPEESLFNDCTSILFEYLLNLRTTTIIIYLDSPVSLSKKHRRLLINMAAQQLRDMEVILAKSADDSLLSHTFGVLATSDSAVIDNSENPILDIPKIIIEKKYHYSLTNLGTLLK